MTWSIIARDPATGQFGIAVATKFFAVGARVPHIVAGVGGIATQALVNPYYGIDGVKLLQDGKSPQETVSAIKIILMLTVLTLAPAILIMMTARGSSADR